MGNVTSKTNFNTEVYEMIISKIPEHVNKLICDINEAATDEIFDHSVMLSMCYNFINDLINKNVSFSSKLDDVYINGLAAGLAAYLLSFEASGPAEHSDAIIDYVKRLISIINIRQ